MIAGSVFERDGGMADKGIGVGGYGIAGEPEDSEIGEMESKTGEGMGGNGNDWTGRRRRGTGKGG